MRRYGGRNFSLSNQQRAVRELNLSIVTTALRELFDEALEIIVDTKLFRAHALALRRAKEEQLIKIGCSRHKSYELLRFSAF